MKRFIRILIPVCLIGFVLIVLYEIFTGAYSLSISMQLFVVATFLPGPIIGLVAEYRRVQLPGLIKKYHDLGGDPDDPIIKVAEELTEKDEL